MNSLKDFKMTFYLGDTGENKPRAFVNQSNRYCIQFDHMVP